MKKLLTVSLLGLAVAGVGATLWDPSLVRLQPPQDDKVRPPSAEELVGRVVQSLRSVKGPPKKGEVQPGLLELRAIEVVGEE